MAGWVGWAALLVAQRAVASRRHASSQAVACKFSLANQGLVNFLGEHSSNSMTRHDLGPSFIFRLRRLAMRLARVLLQKGHRLTPAEPLGAAPQHALAEEGDVA